jgi:hypothetical protein
MKIEISSDKSSATIDGVEYTRKGKKISEWLNELPDGYRELALANFDYKNQGLIIPNDDIVNSINDALYSGFVFNISNEGSGFWYSVGDYYNGKITELPPLPKPKFEVWKPKVDDIVYEISYNGDVEDGIFFSDQCFYTAFKTEAEAIEAHKKAMFNYEVEMFIKEKNEGWLPDWTNVDQIKCLITFNDGFLDCDFCRTYKGTSDCKYFKSREIGEEIIAKFDNEKLVKWWI